MSQPKVIVYTGTMCPYCTIAKRLLNNKGVQFEEVRVDESDERRKEMEQRSGRRSIPQIFIGETHVGGYDDLAALDRQGKLDPLLGVGVSRTS